MINLIAIKPKESTWTDEQWNAIYQSGSNMIVSAGAGSGKTAVLTERIIEKLKQGISISSLVVLTFTRAAAFEMKTRVRDKIKKEIKKGNKQLEKELAKIDVASITTFDSYSLALVKKYHYLLGIKKNIEIADSVLLDKKKKELMEEVFKEFYQKKDVLFLNLLDTFTIKDDEKIKNVCLKLNQSLESLTNKSDYLNHYLEIYYSEEKIQKRISDYEKLLENEKNQIQSLLGNLQEDAVHTISNEFVTKVTENLEPLFSSITYDEYQIFTENYHSILFPRSKKIEETELSNLKTNYEKIKKHIDQIKNLCAYENKEELKNSVLKTKETVSILISILKEYDLKLMDYKNQESMYEFSDISRLAITLLETYPEIRETLKAEIQEIMIDEYQDTNDIGDYFISLISNHNVYMVGDIKQSIYRFRNANPSIFMDKYNRYLKHEDGEKIDLTKNFRSRREVLEDINFLFEKIMDEEIGGADYSSGHKMIFGNDNYEKSGKTDQNYHFEILNYPYQKTEIAKKYRTEEIEAFLIAYNIKNKVQNHYQVYDKDKQILRDACYKDFCILLDRKNSFDLYKKIFTFLKIPLTIHKEESFVYSDEIFVLQNIMKWIFSLLNQDYAQEHLKYAVMSISRSMIGRISDEDLFVFLMNHKEDLLDGLNDVKNPVYDTQQKMIYLANYSKTHTLSEVLEEIYKIFEIYHSILTLQNIELLTIKLDYLLDIARNLEKLGYQINDFIDYLEDARQGKNDVTFSINQDVKGNSVNLMTIHKSKGLEYYICYYAGLQKKFSKADLKEKFLFHPNIGFLVPYFEEGVRENFYKELLKTEYQREEISERLRVFYVALTRAKEKMILVTNLEDYQEEVPKRDFIDRHTRLEYKSFHDILVSIKPFLKPYLVPITLEKIKLTKDYEKIKEMNYQNLLSKSNDPIRHISLSLEKRTLLEKHLSESYHMIDLEEQKRLDLGIKLHECLQYIDYQNVHTSLEEMELSDFEKKKINAFFNQAFFKNLKGPKFYPELEFIEEMNDEKIHGIIDLLIVDLDQVYVVDYKLKNIEKVSYEKQVKGYMNIVKQKMNLSVTGILYSLLDETYLEIH